MQVRSLGQEDPLEKEMATHSSILAWEILRTGAWRATVHRVAKSWTQMKRLGIHGEGNGNPLQYSCLGNPTDREAWLCYPGGVRKSQT